MTDEPKLMHTIADGEHVLRMGTVICGDGERTVIATNVGVYIARDDGTLKMISGGNMQDGVLVSYQ